MNKHLKTFVNLIKEKMDGRTDLWLSQNTGISQSKISRLMRLEAEPSIDDLQEIAKALKCSPHELLDAYSDYLGKVTDDTLAEVKLMNQELAKSPYVQRKPLKKSDRENKEQVFSTSSREELFTELVAILITMNESELSSILGPLRASRSARASKGSIG